MRIQPLTRFARCARKPPSPQRGEGQSGWLPRCFAFLTTSTRYARAPLWVSATRHHFSGLPSLSIGPTATIVNAFGRKYFFATAKTSSGVTASISLRYFSRKSKPRP